MGAPNGGRQAGRVDARGELIERRLEVAELRAATAAARRGAGSTVLIEGPAGIGKTALGLCARREATSSGFQVLVARGGELERELPWTVARELFSPALAEARDSGQLDELLSGSAALARAVLEGGDGRPADPAPGADALSAALHGLYWLCSNLAERGPVLLVVDDVHLADPQSLDLVGYLAQRLTDLALLVVVTARPPEPGKSTRLPAGLLGAERLLRPLPLSEAGAGELLARDVDSAPEPEFAAACHALTAGNPHLLSELGRELRGEGVAPRAANLAALRDITPEGITRAVLLRLSRFPQPAARLAEAVAVLGVGARLADAANLAGLDADAASIVAGELAKANVLADGLPLTYAHPIIHGVVYEEISDARRSLLHARAAETLNRRDAPAGEVAIQLLRAEPAADPEAVEILRSAARESLVQGAPGSAVDLLRRALAEPPGEGAMAGVLLELAESEAAIGSARALERLEEALAIVDSPRRRGEILFKLGWLLFNAGRPSKAGEAFRRGSAALDDADPELASMLATAGLGMGALAGGVGPDALRELLAGAETATPRAQATKREVLTQLALAAVLGGGSHEQGTELAERALGDRAMLEESGVTLTFSIAASCLIWSDALLAAEREIERALALLRERGDILGTAYVRFGRAWVCYWSGRLAEAAADAATAARAWSGGGRLAGQLPLARYWHAVALVELDETEQAAAALGELDDAWDAHYRLNWLAGRARVALAGGDPARAREDLRQVELAAPENPFVHSPAPFPWRADAALAAARLGERDEARRLAAEELELARRFGAPRAVGIALRGTGVVAGGTAGIAALEESVATLERSPSRLELCRSLVELGALLRRGRARARAREPLTRGLALAHELGAIALERRAREELTAAGGRPRRAMLSGPESLTPSERRVCQFAADGLSNREIAEQLFVSLRTVETHLTHAYRKLDVGSRGELAAAFGDSP